MKRFLFPYPFNDPTISGEWLAVDREAPTLTLGNRVPPLSAWLSVYRGR